MNLLKAHHFSKICRLSSTPQSMILRRSLDLFHISVSNNQWPSAEDFMSFQIMLENFFLNGD